MLPPTLQHEVEEALGQPAEQIRQINGGSIHRALRADTPKGAFFVKYSLGKAAAALLQSEEAGLKALRGQSPLHVPEVVSAFYGEGFSFLALPFLEEKVPTAQDWEQLGAGLAELHRRTNPQFGFTADNHIGRLPQPNAPVAGTSWAAFYQDRRLRPQVNLAIRSGLLWPGADSSFERFYQQLPSLFPEEPPALIHGDLWSGNVLLPASAPPSLIDPSVSYSHREMDLGMARLFGGFSPRFFEAYQAHYPLQPGYQERVPYAQLYYLLAHVNLFGRSYTQQVKDIIAAC